MYPGPTLHAIVPTCSGDFGGWISEALKGKFVKSQSTAGSQRFSDLGGDPVEKRHVLCVF